MFTVKQVAKLSGVSVRTLHHYDHVGLLAPSAVSEAGYRLYGDGDLERLQQILFFRELGFALKDIKDLLDAPDFDRLEALHHHRSLLAGMQGRLHKLLETCDRTIAHLKGGPEMANEDLFEGFEDDPEQRALQQEAKERWGHTDAWKQSQQRMKHYTKADYDKLKADGKAAMQALGRFIGRPADDPELQAQMAENYRYINETFYDCPLEMYRNLGSMYVDDPRFAANYDKVAPGLAVLVRDAIHVWVDRQLAGAKPR